MLLAGDWLTRLDSCGPFNRREDERHGRTFARVCCCDVPEATELVTRPVVRSRGYSYHC